MPSFHRVFPNALLTTIAFAFFAGAALSPASAQDRYESDLPPWTQNYLSGLQRVLVPVAPSHELLFVDTDHMPLLNPPLVLKLLGR